jgi:hypothetical protein
MKKLLFVLPVMLLAAASCNSSSSQPTTQQTQPTQQAQATPNQQVAPDPTPTPTPTPSRNLTPTPAPISTPTSPSTPQNIQLSVSVTSSLQATYDKPFQATFKPAGGKPPYAWDGDLTSFGYMDSAGNRVSFMNFKRVDCDGMPANNVQCYEIYGTPPSGKLGANSFPFQVILKDSAGSTVSKVFTLNVN